MAKPTSGNVVALYARVSGHAQEKEATIDTQVNKMLDRAAERGYTVHDRYLDNPYTGTVMDRPQLNKLMEAAQAGHFGRVLCYDPDRMSRGEPWMLGALEHRLASYGVEVEYIDYTRADGETGDFMHGLRPVLSAWERGHILRRFRDGRENRLNQGLPWTPVPPYGWRYVCDADSDRLVGTKRVGYLELHPQEEAVVRQMFDWVLEGRSAAWIAKELNTRGVPSATRIAWRPCTVTGVIHNPIHRGQAALGRYRRVRTGQGGRVRGQRPQGEWRYVQLDQAIVTAEEQAEAERLLAANWRSTPREQPGSFLLGGLLKCGLPHPERPGLPCGSTLTGTRPGGGRSPAYRCNRRGYGSVGAAGCKGRIAAASAEAAIWGFVVDLLRDPAALRVRMEAASADTTEARAKAEGELAAASKAVDAAQGKLDVLLDAHLDGTIDKETYARKQALLVQQRTQAEAWQAHAQAALSALAGREIPWATIEQFAKIEGEKLAALEQPENRPARRDLIRTFVRQATITVDGQIDVEFTWDRAASASVAEPSVPC